jgi:hypothetical protein
MARAHAQAFASTELDLEVCCELVGEDQMRAAPGSTPTFSIGTVPIVAQILSMSVLC